jgi:protein farnesyltransferase/geranylgeranyltransferase type-1 subunit alpha
MIEAIASSTSLDSQEMKDIVRQEEDFVAKMFKRDAKNYHVWSYLQWLVQRFDLWDSAQELEAVDELLKQDPRNNSGWNHRYYVLFGNPNSPKTVAGHKVLLDREVDYATGAICVAPQNQSPWSYLRGVLSSFKLSLSYIKAIAEEFADIQKPDEVRSSHALDILAEIYKEEKQLQQAKEALDLLAKKYDPIRSRYWRWRKEQLGTAAA